MHETLIAKFFVIACVTVLTVLLLWDGTAVSFLAQLARYPFYPGGRFPPPNCQRHILDAFAVGENLSTPILTWLPQPSPVSPECYSVFRSASAAKQNENFTQLELLTQQERRRIQAIVHRLHGNFSERHLELFLSDGSLIGSLRHFGFIPWDADVDFMIRVDQKPMVRDLLVALSAEDEYQFQDTESTNQHWQLHILCVVNSAKPKKKLYNNGQLYPEKECKAFVDFFFGRIDKPGVYHRPEAPHTFSSEDIYPLRLRPFGEYLVPAPRNPHGMLTRSMGSSSYMALCHRKYVKPVTVACDTLRTVYPFAWRVRLLFKNRALHAEVLVKDSAMLALFVDSFEH